ncbi:MAG: L-glyceraldehyde 3-phosphate reductase [Treponema sp. GWB1_62_6]|nr:MAG: L-glyceraldehyde 3-phosphate reductase [Treponema sp. GWB1_62_6]HCM28877.1 L-glyceraldehyde 3-phosphate reductase [Treponema sp.]
MEYAANENRYESMPYRRCGKSGLDLPILSLGFWHNFGGNGTYDNARAMTRAAFDLGITHFDLANNYGPPPGSAEETMGRLLRDDFRPYRNELVISTKAGYHMWPGPYGDRGSRKYLLSSLDASLRRMGLDYVDIFYSHRPDLETPLEETMGALAQAVKSGKALYVGLSNYPADRTREAAAILRESGVPCLIHQPKYHMLERWIEQDLLSVCADEGMGIIAFMPLAQGVLTDRYLHGIPVDSRAASASPFLKETQITELLHDKISSLNAIASGRGQSLAQMAIAWTLRDARVTSALIGASRPEQIVENVKAAARLTFTAGELAEIDKVLAQ